MAEAEIDGDFQDILDSFFGRRGRQGGTNALSFERLQFRPPQGRFATLFLGIDFHPFISVVIVVFVISAVFVIFFVIFFVSFILYVAVPVRPRVARSDKSSFQLGDFLLSPRVFPQFLLFLREFLLFALLRGLEGFEPRTSPNILTVSGGETSDGKKRGQRGRGDGGGEVLEERSEEREERTEDRGERERGEKREREERGER